MPDSIDLEQSFETAFMHIRDRLESQKGKRHWAAIEYWQDKMAGPLYSIVRRGGCEYVYACESVYFTGVHDPESLKSRLLEWHATFAEKVEFIPASDAETRDLSTMRSQVGGMRVIIDLAMDIESRRWQRSRQNAVDSH